MLVIQTVSEFRAVSFVVVLTCVFCLPYVRANCFGGLRIAGLTKLSTGLQPSYPQEKWIAHEPRFFLVSSKAYSLSASNLTAVHESCLSQTGGVPFKT